MARNDDRPAPLDESVLESAMSSYLQGLEPADGIAGFDVSFTTAEALEAIQKVFSEHISSEQIYLYLYGEGYGPHKVGDDLVWLAKKV